MTAKLLMIFLYFKGKKQEKGKTLLLHDGQVYDIYWITRVEEDEKTTGKLRPIHLINAKGNSLTLKPVQTWIGLVPNYTTFWKTVDSEKHHIFVNGRSRGSYSWLLYF